ncbi:MAG TPA: hypothetical protein PKY88_00865 [Anaerohalosphaeraceae bacterium]|nr:hypothetical protein [Anaerohalosphaeraceae bacterium]
MEGTWSRAPFEKFFIRYGINKNDLAEKNGVLLDRKTGQAVLLFTGLWSSLLSKTYRKLSTALYMELVKAGESDEAKEEGNSVHTSPQLQQKG